MLDLALLVLFCVMAYRITAGTRRASATFEEFKLPKTIAPLALLFPLGPVMLLGGRFLLPAVLTLALAAACYVPAFVAARGMGNALDRAGTDRVRPAREVVSQAQGTALVGFIYVALSLLYTLSVSFIK